MIEDFLGELNNAIICFLRGRFQAIMKRMSEVQFSPSVTLGDAFGNALRECWRLRIRTDTVRTGAVFVVQERDDGFVLATDVARFFTPLTAMGPVDKWACAQAVGRVLDVGCGAGRHALALMRSGHEVVGIDTSPGAVEVARARGVNAVEGSIDDIDHLGTFETVLLLGNNLGLLESADRAPQILDRLASLVPPGGRVIGSSSVLNTQTCPEHLAYRARNLQRGLTPGQLHIRIRWHSVTTEWFDYLSPSPDELLGLINDSQWKLSDSVSGRFDYAVTLGRQAA
jgi:SAM-dependent methyltransferase